MIAEHSEAAWKVGGGLCQLKRLKKSKWRHWEGGMLKITTLVAARRPIRRGAENYFLYRWPWTRTWESDWLEGFPGGSDGKAPARNAGDPGSISGLGNSPGEGNGTPLQYACLESPMDGGAWWAVVHGVAEEPDTTEQLHFRFSLSWIGEGNGNPLQCFCLENPRDGGAW